MMCMVCEVYLVYAACVCEMYIVCSVCVCVCEVHRVVWRTCVMFIVCVACVCDACGMCGVYEGKWRYISFF